jgi:hypothetical protein
MAETAETSVYLPSCPRRRPSTKTPPGTKRRSGSNPSTPVDQRHGSLVSDDSVSLTVRTLDKKEYHITAERGMLVRQLREAVAASTGIEAENQVCKTHCTPKT